MNDYRPSAIANLARELDRVKYLEEQLVDTIEIYDDPRSRTTWEDLGGPSKESTLREAEMRVLVLLRECQCTPLPDTPSQGTHDNGP